MVKLKKKDFGDNMTKLQHFAGIFCYIQYMKKYDIKNKVFDESYDKIIRDIEVYKIPQFISKRVLNEARRSIG